MAKQKGETIKKIFALLISVVVIGLLAFLVTWSPSPDIEPLRTATVETQDVQNIIEVSGVVTTRTIDDEEQKAVQVFVDETDIIHLDVEQEVRVSLRSFEDEEFDGTIDSLSDEPRMSGDITEYEVIIQLQDLPDDVRNGMHADVSITLASVDDVLAVPTDALYTQEDTYYVDLVREKTRVQLSRLGVNRTVQETEQQEVSVGLEGDEFTEITEGLKEGEIIVAE